MKIDLNRSVELITEKLDQWFELVVSNLPNLVLAILLSLVFVGIAKLAKNIARRFIFARFSNQGLSHLFETTIYLTVIALGLFLALEILHLDKAVASLIAGAGIIGLALSFAFQDIAANFVSGIMIAVKQPYRIGDLVEVEGVVGEVTNIDLRTTSVVTFDGIETFVPNKNMFTKSMSNYTTTPKRRVDINMGVAYSTDLEQAAKIAVETVEKIDGLLDDTPVQLFYTGFGASSIDFVIHCWIHYPADNNFLRFRHKAIIALQKAFADNEIDIPFPIRTLQLADVDRQSLKEGMGVLNSRQKGNNTSAMGQA